MPGIFFFHLLTLISQLNLPFKPFKNDENSTIAFGFGNKTWLQRIWKEADPCSK